MKAGPEEQGRATYILEIASYDGDDTRIQVEERKTPDEAQSAWHGADSYFQPVTRQFAVISVGPRGAGIIDQGYRSVAEAKAMWPEAIEPETSEVT